MNITEDKSAGNKHGLTRAIPEDVKREVRQRCGFGCIICGLGLYEYEHFSPEFVDAKFHDPKGITLLCPNHHASKTKKTLSIDTILRANEHPMAVKQRFANEKIDLTTDPIVVLGTARFKRTPIILQIEDEPIIVIQPGADEAEPFLLTAMLRDKFGNTTLNIIKNEWKTTTDSWDVRVEGNRLEIRSAPRNIELVFRQEPPNKVVIERLSMLHREMFIETIEGRHFKFKTENGINAVTKNISVTDYEIGLYLQKSGVSTIGMGSMKRSSISVHIDTMTNGSLIVGGLVRFN